MDSLPVRTNSFKHELERYFPHNREASGGGGGEVISE